MRMYIQQHKTLFLFFLRALAVYLVWYLVYVLWLQPTGFDAWMNQKVAYGGHLLVNALGYESCLENNQICVNIISTVHISAGCNGFDIICIFAGFIIIFNGSWLKKIIFIAAGVVLLYALNVVRVALLAIDHYKNLKLFAFNHKYTYLIAMYAVVFGLWALWVFKISKPTAHEST